MEPRQKRIRNTVYDDGERRGGLLGRQRRSLQKAELPEPVGSPNIVDGRLLSSGEH